MFFVVSTILHQLISDAGTLGVGPDGRLKQQKAASALADGPIPRVFFEFICLVRKVLSRTSCPVPTSNCCTISRYFRTSWHTSWRLQKSSKFQSKRSDWGEALFFTVAVWARGRLSMITSSPLHMPGTSNMSRFQSWFRFFSQNDGRWSVSVEVYQWPVF